MVNEEREVCGIRSKKVGLFMYVLGGGMESILKKEAKGGERCLLSFSSFFLLFYSSCNYNTCIRQMSEWLSGYCTLLFEVLSSFFFMDIKMCMCAWVGGHACMHAEALNIIQAKKQFPKLKEEKEKNPKPIPPKEREKWYTEGHSTPLVFISIFIYSYTPGY